MVDTFMFTVMVFAEDQQHFKGRKECMRAESRKVALYTLANYLFLGHDYCTTLFFEGN